MARLEAFAMVMVVCTDHPTAQPPLLLTFRELYEGLIGLLYGDFEPVQEKFYE